MKIPASSSEISVEWLNSMLSSDNKIVSFEIDENFGPWSLLGKAVRVKLGWEKAESEPKSVIVKFQVSCSNPKREGEIYNFLKESNVQFIPKLFGIFGDGNLVMEDLSLTHLVDYNDFIISQVRKVVSIIADVNSRFWNDSRVPREDVSHFINSININFEQGWDNFKRRYQEKLGKEIADFEWMRENAGIVSRQYNSGQTTLSHGDINRSNLLFPNDGSGKPILIDWQLAGHKVLSFDLSYFLIKILSIEQRREYENSLLKEYYDLLSDQIRKDFPFERMVLHYRACATRSMLSAVTRLSPKFDSQPKRFETADRLADRVIAAVKDLRPIEAIQELEKRGWLSD